MLEVVLRELERIFLEDSGLAEARPGVRVSVSRPAHYLELLENIQVHGYHLMRGRGRVLENAEVAADWYDAIYTPTLAAIDRLRSLEAAFADGAFPPIVTVKLGETYFVIDGHHRVALARRGGAEMIDADVTELVALVPLPAGADMLEVVLRELERIFLEDSGLAEARPGARVSVSRPAHYLELLENVQIHGYHLMRGRERVLANAEIAADWYDAIYTPTLAAIDSLRLGSLYRDAPPGDLFLILHRHRRDAFPSTGCPHLAQTVVSVIGDSGRRRRISLPRRRRRSPAT